MFGFVVARQDALSEEELARYKQVYCGLCRRLGERYGQLSRLSLTYDMTFLTLLLQSLYEPEETGGIRGCAAHPVHRRAWSASEATDYAADMTVALMWHKCRDDWQDDQALRARVYEALLGGAYHQVRERYPRQCEAIERLRRAGVLEKLSRELRDAAAARTAHPDLALTALASTFDPPVSRATLNYRLQRLLAIDRETNGGDSE